MTANHDWAIFVVNVFSPAFSRPPGVFEFPNFANGTKSMMDAVVKATQAGAITIIGEIDGVVYYMYLTHTC